MKDTTTMADGVLATLAAFIKDSWRGVPSDEHELAYELADYGIRRGLNGCTLFDLRVPDAVSSRDLLPAITAAITQHDCLLLPIDWPAHSQRFDTAFYSPLTGEGGFLSITLSGMRTNQLVTLSVLPHTFHFLKLKMLEVELTDTSLTLVLA